MGIDYSMRASVRPPMVVVCHFAHKIDTQTLKSESSASLLPLVCSPSTLPTPSTIAPRPSLGTLWSRWRRKAAGPATDDENSQGGSIYGSPRRYSEDEDSDCVGGQGQVQRHHEDSDQEDRQVPGFTQHRSASRESQTVSSLSSNSQGTASHSGRSSSQSGSQPKRRKHRHSNSQPHPPESPLEDSSHSSRDHRRLQKSRDRMVETRHGKQKAAGGGRGGTALVADLSGKHSGRTRFRA